MTAEGAFSFGDNSYLIDVATGSGVHGEDRAAVGGQPRGASPEQSGFAGALPSRNRGRDDPTQRRKKLRSIGKKSKKNLNESSSKSFRIKEKSVTSLQKEAVARGRDTSSNLVAKLL